MISTNMIRLDRSLNYLGFGKCTQKHLVYIRREGEKSVLVGVYVDDIIVREVALKKSTSSSNR